MKQRISLILFVLGWVVIAAGIIANIDNTLYLNSVQYVAEGETPKPVRMMSIVQDFIGPLYQGGILIGLSYLIGYTKKLDSKA
ncbi:hypothetical protein ABU952_05655 [Bacillus amyloliquefaciens]|uniref:hypothetical protein n=1 Tax=Bacillus amyloliquefaciens TaxID=1390 RepID=UPI00336B453A